MKVKTTLILMIVFAALLAFIFLSDIREKGKPETADKLVDLSSEDIEKIIFKTEEETITFTKENEGDWLITDPLEAKADKYEVDRIAGDFAALDIDRVVEEEPADLEKYGIPQKEISLFFKDKEAPVKILIGMENPLDKKFFAKRADETKVVLIGTQFKSLLDKKIFDFREKKIFQFETDEVKRIVLRSGDIQWEAAMDGEDWMLTEPVKSLAEQSQITTLLTSLSDLKAVEFVSEAKKDEETAEYALDKPEHEVVLELPLENQKVTFFISKNDDKVYATTSLSSKIVEVEDSITENLSKEPGELRDKGIADFYSWEAKKVQVEKGDMTVAAVKDEDGNWHFDKEDGEEADKEKIESLVRTIENLQAEGFIDPPLKLADYGLDNPLAKITISVKDGEDKTKDTTIIIGKTILEKVAKAEEEKGESKAGTAAEAGSTEKAEAKKEEEKSAETAEEEDKIEEKEWVVIKNARFDYLFKAPTEFLTEIPQTIDDWKPPAPEPESEEE
ncbi:DUF4340 domain-containing protein [Acidobacteriota bacterium]